MSTQQGTLESLSQREFELLTLEVPILEQRIAQLENLQYRLRQFSITLWALLLTAGMGLTAGIAASTWILMMAIVLPVMFFYLDALYATMAQSHRTRRDRLIEFVNKRREEEEEKKKRLPLLDLTGKSTDWEDPQAAHRRSILVKLTRKTRLSFYGVQLVGASAALGGWLAGAAMAVSLLILVLARSLKRRQILTKLPSDYSREIDHLADGTPLEEWKRTPLLQSDSASHRP